MSELYYEWFVGLIEKNQAEIHMSQSNQRFLVECLYCQVSVKILRAVYTPFAWLPALLVRKDAVGRVGVWERQQCGE